MIRKNMICIVYTYIYVHLIILLLQDWKVPVISTFGAIFGIFIIIILVYVIRVIKIINGKATYVGIHYMYVCMYVAIIV